MKRLHRYALHFFFWLLVSTLAMSNAHAEVFQSHESIRMATRMFLEHQVNASVQGIRFRINVAELDLNLQLPACASKLQGFVPLGGRLHGRTTVGIRCESGNAWTIYVPALVKVFPRVRVGSLEDSRSRNQA